jgi:hypothetical protein
MCSTLGAVDVLDGATIRVDATGGELQVTYENPPETREAA